MVHKVSDIETGVCMWRFITNSWRVSTKLCHFLFCWEKGGEGGGRGSGSRKIEMKVCLKLQFKFKHTCISEQDFMYSQNAVRLGCARTIRPQRKRKNKTEKPRSSNRDTLDSFFFTATDGLADGHSTRGALRCTRNTLMKKNLPFIPSHVLAHFAVKFEWGYAW